MSGISGINNSLASSYSHLSSGKKINTASDGATELTMIEKNNTQITGYNVGKDNLESGKEVINVSDSALSNVTDSLQRMYELSLSAANTATMSDSDRSALQDEFDQLKQGISDITSQTQYNTKNLLDGSNPAFELATDANGNSTTVETANLNSSDIDLENLSLDDTDAISKALDTVTSMRSNMGAESNRIDYEKNYNAQAAYNALSSKSSLEDLDYPQAVSDQKKQETLQAYSLMMQRKQEEEERNRMNSLFT